MARRVFFSFHYKPDSTRASQVRNIGALEGNSPVSDNDWETITRGGDPAIEKWIAAQMKGTSAVVVLVGEKTAGRKWINHEIIKGWNDGKGVVGIHIHNLKDLSGEQCANGDNPFTGICIGDASMSRIVKCYNPPHMDSKAAYAYIGDNISDWIEEAISIRSEYP